MKTYRKELTFHTKTRRAYINITPQVEDALAMIHETIYDLLEAPEGENYQFKEWKFSGDFDEAVEICCALANCGGGKLVLGITDKRPRKVVGSEAFTQPERTREKLIDKLRVRVDFQIYK